MKRTEMYKFPSPCGDYGSYQHEARAYWQGPIWFPSPCGDYGSYQHMVTCSQRKGNTSFRPLAGIMVLIDE